MNQPQQPPPEHRLILSREVLVIATTTLPPSGPRDSGYWKAFIGVVPGKDHEQEWPHVLDYGDTLAEPIARALFPEFAHMEYDR